MRRAAVLLGAVLAVSSCGQSGGREAATGASPEAMAAADCPERFPATDDAPWVPAPPTTETPGRLVPDADPVEALVCRYGDVFEADSAGLEGEVALEGGLDRIRTDLQVPARVDAAERACTAIGGGFVPHLVRLRYADGELWLSAVQEPNGCSASGNGAFVSSSYLGELLAQAYDSRTWPPRDPDPCARGPLGRAGQERALVPAGWRAIVVCEEDGRRRDVAPDRATRVVDLLSRLALRPAVGGCEGTPTSTSRLVATYPEGPPVVVLWTPGCEPPLGNGSVSAGPTPAQEQVLTGLLG